MTRTRLLSKYAKDSNLWANEKKVFRRPRKTCFNNAYFLEWVDFKVSKKPSSSSICALLYLNWANATLNI